MPATAELRLRDQAFTKKQREGRAPKGKVVEKKPKPAIAPWVVYLLCFVVIGGVFFELIRLFM